MIDPHIALSDVMPLECLRCPDGTPTHAALAKAAGAGWVVVICCEQHGDLARFALDEASLMAWAHSYLAGQN